MRNVSVCVIHLAKNLFFNVSVDIRMFNVSSCLRLGIMKRRANVVDFIIT